MKVENGARILVGPLGLISARLVARVSLWWLLFTAFIGVNLIQSAFTGFCPATKIMKRIGLKE